MTDILLQWVLPIAVVAGYAWMIPRTAKRFSVRETEKYIVDSKAIYYDNPALFDRRIAEQRRENLGFGVFIGFVWPFYYGWRWWADRALGDMPPSSWELDQREKRIAALEKEMGIK